MLQRDYNDDFLLRIGIFLLNSLACQVEGEHKQILGQTGVVEVNIFTYLSQGIRSVAISHYLHTDSSDKYLFLLDRFSCNDVTVFII